MNEKILVNLSKFQYSISKTVGCPHFCMVNISNWGSPLLIIYNIWWGKFGFLIRLKRFGTRNRRLRLGEEQY